MLPSPYFGRLDFTFAGERHPISFYIGIHSFTDNSDSAAPIYDWRAPISGMFYDFEIGPAFYIAPAGRLDGTLNGKRQYRIKNGVLEHFIDTSLNISDEFLLAELAGDASAQMKHIVETIQREQNAVIRDAEPGVLVIQGAAGSGKTSVALHRAAYLLYKRKDDMSAENILIISPNRLFASYISGVLPQLGEDMIPGVDMDELARKELPGFRLMTRYEQTSLLIEGRDKRLIERVKFKSRPGIAKELGDYAANLSATCFIERGIDLDGLVVKAAFIRARFDAYEKHPLRRRIDMVFEDVKEYVRSLRPAAFWRSAARVVRLALDSMLELGKLDEVYSGFYEFVGKPGLVRQSSGKIWEYADIYPLIYLKAAIEGINVYPDVKHVIIDEMQDYTPIEYAVLKLMYPCDATILGDVNQSATPYGSSGETICAMSPGARYVKLSKSYRSTFEIMQFAARIIPDSELSCMERHGDKPVIISCRSRDEELELLAGWAVKHMKDSRASYGVVCKTRAQSRKYYKALVDAGVDVCLLGEDSVKLASGVAVMDVVTAKGLEFGHVAVPGVDALNYADESERRLLYIACTRAQHSLTLLHTGDLTRLIG